ncbi:MAG: helix-turn-helix domain-containing protein [Bacillota bacterium]|nr:helix-turn-helix domain-containing protein [Bacillota bacterium]
MDIIDCLMNIGLTRYESILYISLCKEGDLTGYEAAKISGIPRSNAYLALAGLVEKGGAYRIESEVVRYTVVPVSEFLSNMRKRYDNLFKFIEKNVPERDNTRDAYITISGKINIVNKMKNMILNASQRIYISVSEKELTFVEEELKTAVKRGLKVVIITSSPCRMEGTSVYHIQKEPGQVRLIVDTEQVLTGELGLSDNDTCLFTSNKNLIQLIKDTLTNEMKLTKEIK